MEKKRPEKKKVRQDHMINMILVARTDQTRKDFDGGGIDEVLLLKCFMTDPD